MYHCRRTNLLVAAMAAAGFSSWLTVLPAHAATPQNDDILQFDPGVTGGNYGFVTGGSYFAMDTNGNGVHSASERTALSVGTQGIIIGTIQPSVGGHGGAVTGTEGGTVDAAWGFFGNTGIHRTNSAITGSTTVGLNMSGWAVSWNTIGNIPMGGGFQDCGTSTDGICDPDGAGGSPDIAGTFNNGNGIATFTWNGVYGDPFTLDYTANVPQGDPSNFGGVFYGLRLTGRVLAAGINTALDNAVTVTDTPVSINVIANDVASDGIDPTSVSITTPPTNGTAVPNSDGTVTYTPGTGFTGADTFEYTVMDLGAPPATSVPTDVSVSVQVNTPPVAVDDSATVFGISGLTVDIDVTANDTDSNGTNSSGNILPATASSVQIVTQPVHGTATVLSNGKVRYTSNGQVGMFPFTYRVTDRAGAQSANAATVTVDARAFTGDFDNPVPANRFALLTLDPGSEFTMQLSALDTVNVPLSAGPAGGIVLLHNQFAAGSHNGAPTGTEVTNVDQPWSFFSNTGIHFTTNGGIGINADGTLDFDNKWFVTWNGIPAINMGGSAVDNPLTKGIAAIACTPAPCADTSTYTLVYNAIVPPGDPSGFGGVPYGLNLNGKVRFISTDGQVAAGTLTQGSLGIGIRVSKAQVAADAGVTEQCIGDCFDYQVSGVGNGNNASVTFALAGGIPVGAELRKFKSGVWGAFDTSQGDTIRSAPLPATGITCPAPGAGSYVNGLVAGNSCIEITIKDGGPNDADGVANGTVVDPSGVGTSAGAPPPDTRTSFASGGGCSLSKSPSGLMNGGGWLGVAGFFAWMAYHRRRRARRSS